ncbi:MAG: hypothetical protein CVT92_14540 [Bacteroidetes bacterium HGW-Bacteroidetes-1]|jgi:hypothetical protein|nr:MAG: hypothetical protein CVT92_14540 [Bacteroidetes bacterium HGW-Bacteroidetes-1]
MHALSTYRGGWIKQLLFGLIVLMMVLPALQSNFSFIAESPLTGSFTVSASPSLDSLTFISWIDGSFQKEYNKNLEAHIGFHNSLVRLNNQWQYSFFRKANAEGVIVGKHAELFEEDYIRAATGEFFVGHDVWQQKAVKLKAIQDTLQSLGKTLLVVFEPGKGSVYADLYPAKYRGKNEVSNYWSFVSSLDSLNVNNLDLNACFVQWRDDLPYRLFPRTGTHWSYYGAALAADTTLRHLNTFFEGKIPMLVMDSLFQRNEPRHPDDDIWLAMNLLTKVPYENLAYPALHFEPVDQPKIKALVVGDSFYFNWQSDKIMLNAFADCNFWYYNKHVFSQNGVETGMVADLNFSDEILNSDLIMIMITERFHQNFAWRFDEQLFSYLFPEKQINFLDFFANRIRVSNEEFLRLVDDAQKKNVSLQDRLIQEAKYLMYEDHQKNPNKYVQKEDLIMMLMMSIEGTPDWFAKIKVKAAERNISVNEMLKLDAEWVYNQKYGVKN